MVRELAHSAGIPMPRLYLIPASQPNAFATGRSPKHSAVAVTEGITKLLSESELRGVIAHELAHIRNRDTLIQSVAAAIGGAITWIAYMLLFMGGDDDSPLGLVGALAMVILAPIAATIIQLAISRQREYAADATGARSRAARTRWPTRWSAWRRAPRRCRCRSTPRPSRCTSSSRSAEAEWPRCSRPTPRSRSACAACARLGI